MVDEDKLAYLRGEIEGMYLDDEEKMTLGMELVVEAGKNSFIAGIAGALSESPEAMGFLGGIIDQVSSARPPKSNRDRFPGA